MPQLHVYLINLRIILKIIFEARVVILEHRGRLTHVQNIPLFLLRNLLAVLEPFWGPRVVRGFSWRFWSTTVAKKVILHTYVP